MWELASQLPPLTSVSRYFRPRRFAMRPRLARSRPSSRAALAGIANGELLSEVSLEDWRRVIDVNLTGSFLLARACYPHLRQVQNSTIVNFSSGQGLQPFMRRGAYAASKAGVISLSKSLAMEWAPIRVNTICPGAVDTPMVRNGYDPEVLRTQVGARYALGRVAEAVEIARAALYLTGGESSFITGVALAVDGGRSYH